MSTLCSTAVSTTPAGGQAGKGEAGGEESSSGAGQRAGEGEGKGEGESAGLRGSPAPLSPPEASAGVGICRQDTQGSERRVTMAAASQGRQAGQAGTHPRRCRPEGARLTKRRARGLGPRTEAPPGTPGPAAGAAGRTRAPSAGRQQAGGGRHTTVAVAAAVTAEGGTPSVGMQGVKGATDVLAAELYAACCGAASSLPCRHSLLTGGAGWK